MRLQVCVAALTVVAASHLAAQNEERRPAAAHVEFDHPGSLTAPIRGVINNATARLDIKTRAVRVVEGLVIVRGAKTPEDAAERFISETFKIKPSGNGITRL